MDPREIAYKAFLAGIEEESRQNVAHRLEAVTTGYIDWTIEEAVAAVRALAKVGHANPEARLDRRIR